MREKVRKLGKKKTLIEQAMVKNTLSYMKYKQQLFDLAISLFHWKNIPDTIDPRYIELCLFERGSAVWFVDPFIGNLCLPWVNKGSFNVYGNPITYNAISSYNSYQFPLNNLDSVIIWNNHLKTNSIEQLGHYAEMLALIDRIMEVNINSQKTPVLIKASEAQRLSMLNLYEQWDGNTPFIFADKMLDTNDLQALTANSPFVADKLMDLKEKIWNEALTFLGVSNVTFEKKDRMLRDEVNRMLGGTFASRNSRLMSRQFAAEKINKMFGLNISVEFSDGVSENLNGIDKLMEGLKNE